MSHEQIAAAPLVDISVERTVLPPAAEASVPAPTPEEVRAADTAFVPDDGANTALNLFGIWTSLVLLRDLAIENFTTPPEQPRLGREQDEPDRPER